MRHLVFGHLDLSAAAQRALDPPLTWNGWPVPGPLRLFILAAMGVAVLAVAVKRFSTTD